MTGMQRDVEVFEQHLAAALQCHVGNNDHDQLPLSVSRE